MSEMGRSGGASGLRRAAEVVISWSKAVVNDGCKLAPLESDIDALRAAVAEAERLVPTDEEREAMSETLRFARRQRQDLEFCVSFDRLQSYFDRIAPKPTLDDLARAWLADPGNDPLRVRLWRRLDELSDRTYLFKAGDDKVSVRLRPGETAPDRHYPIEVS